MDPQIDFGWQLYVPWRLSLGEHLGRDYIHPYGPLSAYVNAALFRLFGPNIQTLVIANLAIYGGIVISLYQLLRVAFGFTGAAVATWVGIVVFGFGNHSWVSNYTYLAPYSHEATHGIALLLGLLLLLVRAYAMPRPSGWWTGVVLGFVCLTKIEAAFAAIVSVAATAWLMARGRQAGRPCAIWLGGIAAGAAVVLGVAWLLLALAMDAGTAFRVATGGLLAPWWYREIASDEVSVSILGLDNVAGNVGALVQLGLGGIAYVSGLTLVLRWAGLASGPRWRGAAAAMVTAMLMIAGIWLLQKHSIRTGRLFPLLMLVGAAALLVAHFVQRRLDRPRVSRRAFAQLLLWVAGMAMMSRVMLAPKVYHYGFYLTMLAGVWLTGFFVAEWPRLTVRRSAWRFVLGAEFAATALAGAGFLLADSLHYYEPRTQALGEGADAIRGLQPGIIPAHSIIESTRKYLSESTPADSSVLVLPEGTMLNYWTRRKHPLKAGDVLPPTLRQFRATLVPDLEKAAPDYVVVMTRIVTEYKPFGSDADSGRDVLQWLSRHYVIVAGAGSDPLSPLCNAREFGVRVYQRAALPPGQRLGPVATE